MKSCPKCSGPMRLLKDTDGSYWDCWFCGLNEELGRDGQPLAPLSGNGPWRRIPSDKGMRSVANVKVREGVHLPVKRGAKRDLKLGKRVPGIPGTALTMPSLDTI